MAKASGTHQLSHRVVDAMTWMAASVGLQMVVKLVVTAILARLLMPEDFGVVAALLMVVGIANHVVFTGIGQSVIQRQDPTPAFRFAMHLLSIGVGLGLTAAAWLAAPAWTGFMKVGYAADGMKLIAVVFIVRAIVVVPEYELSREFQFRFVALLDFVSYLAGFGIVTIAGALLGFGYEALIVGAICHQALRTLALLRVARLPPRARVQGADFGDAARAAFGFSGVNVINAFAADIDNIIVARSFGPAALGLYARAYDLMKYPASLYMKVFGRIALAAFSAASAEEQRLVRGYLKAAGVMALTGLTVSAVLFVLAEPIIHLLLGRNWDGMILPFQIFCAGMYFRLAFRLPTAALQAVGRLRLVTWLYVGYAVFIVLGALAGVPYGLPGVAAGVTAALVVNFFVFSALAGRSIPFGYGQLLRVHGPGFNLSVVCLVAGLAATHACGDAPDLVVLGAGSAACGLAALAAIRVSQAAFLGAHGAEFLGRLLQRLPSGRLVGRLLGVAIEPRPAKRAAAAGGSA